MNNILIETRDRLRARIGQLAKISHESGLSYSWLTKFSDGRINNPTIRTFHQLIEYLDNNPDYSNKDRAA